jgi:hypothetical protein
MLDPEPLLGDLAAVGAQDPDLLRDCSRRGMRAPVLAA